MLGKAQVTQEWVRLYPDTNTFTAGAFALTTDDSGNVYVTGYAEASSSNNYCTIKYSSAGERLWVSNYYGQITGGRYAYAIAVDQSYNVYVTGYSYRAGSDFDYCTIKYNLTGVQQWVKYYDGPISGEDEAEKVTVDNSGNIYVSGFSQVTGANGFSYTTIKYSTIGNFIWLRTYPGTSPMTYVTAIATDDSCHVYITGGYTSKAVTIKYDSSGNQLWAQEYYGLGPNGQTWANSLALDNYHNIYIAGLTHGLHTGHDFFTIKYSYDGVQQWVRRFNIDSTDGDNEANSIAVDNAGNIFVSGFSCSSNFDPMKLTTLKYSNSGDLLWVKRDSSALTNQSTYMAVDQVNNIYIAAATTDLSLQIISYLIIKYNSLGIEQWRKIFNFDTGGVYPRSLYVDDGLNVYITGNYSYYSESDMCTLKYSQPVGIINAEYQTPKFFKLFQNYPNPFNSSTKIRFIIPHNKSGEKGGITKLTVYDILGQEVSILVNYQLKPGTYDIEWDGSNYSSGIYFYKIEAGDYIETKKMVLIK